MTLDEKYLPVLAIETSSVNCGVSIYYAHDDFITYNVNRRRAHSEKLMVEIELLCKSENIELNKIGSVAVSAGPGSFTGLRIGMSAAKAICMGAGLPLILVPTFNAIGLQVSYFLNEHLRFAIANRVNVSEVYFAEFFNTFDSFAGESKVELIEADSLKKRLGCTNIFFGNNDLVEERKKRIDAPNPEYVAEWAYFFGKDLLTYDYDYLEPDYLKKFIAKVKK